MDEVEAALDDVNLHRFLGLIHEFRQEAQLLVVSHQKRTMEAGDSLLGVTMQPGGSVQGGHRAGLRLDLSGQGPIDERLTSHGLVATNTGGVAGNRE
jgi:ABC-type transport system involved in cytochrome bd biosynthesis fused ATPase/permease subunit